MIIIFQQADIFGSVGEDFDELRMNLLFGLHEGGQCLFEFFHRMHGLVVEASLFGPAFGMCRVRGCHEAVRPVLHLQSGQRLEDFSASVIEQHDTQVAAQVIAPQRVHVVEETQVANQDEVEFVGNPGIAQSRR